MKEPHASKAEVLCVRGCNKMNEKSKSGSIINNNSSSSRINKSMLILTAVVVVMQRVVSVEGSQGLKFSIEPKDMVVQAGNSVLLPCDGAVPTHSKKIGTTKIPIKIRWRGPDGQDIGIDTFRFQFPNGSLYISSVEDNRGLTGTYHCLLTADGIGTIVSRSAKVSIAKLPDTNHLFTEIYVNPGQTAYFKCLSKALEPGIRHEVHWLKDEAPLHLDESRMTIFPSGSIEIDEVNGADGGSYQCKVTSGTVSKLSSKSNLNIKPIEEPRTMQAPFSLTESSSQTVQEGDTVTLECVSNGFPKPLVKWLRNGEDIDISDLDSRFRIIGTGSLQISHIDESDFGNYQCRSSNAVDSLDIQASVLVQVPPKFIESPQDKVALEKEELELVCSIRGKPTPIIQWLKNGDVITPNDYMQVVGGNNLRILGLINSDAGMFQCVGSNPAGSVQAAARLQIVEADHLSKKQKQILAKSRSTTVQQQAKQSGPEKTTKSLSKNVFESLLFEDKEAKPVLSPASSEDYYGDYDDDNDDDVDDNADGTDENAGHMGLDQEDEGSIHPYGPGVDPKKLLHTLTDTNVDDDAAISRLPIKDSQEISHFSQSPFPTVTRKYPPDGTKLDEAPLPGPPRDLVAQIVNPRFVALSWMEPLKNPDEVVSYTVYYKMTTSERERKITTKSRDEQLANIQALLPGKTYQFRVVGNSNNGPGESSNVYEVSTQPEENIAGSPQDVQGVAMSHKEIHIMWQQPLVTNGNISKYRIYYSEEEGAEMYTDSMTLEAVLSDLRPFTEYTVSVVPFNQNGMGDPSNELTIKTYSSTPQESPINVTVETTSSTSITIRWEPPPREDQNGQIIGYKIRYRKPKNRLQVETTPANVRHYELKGLDKMAAYQVKIAAMTINGTGPFTEWNLIETYENDLTETQVPAEPAWLRTRPSAESIMVTWSPPVESEIKVRGYIISWGLGIPDVNTHVLDENSRYYKIAGLESNSEYVISLRARNLMGDGPPRYDYIRTRDDEPVETALEVPVGLRAITMSASSIVVYWTDTTLNRNQKVIDNRQYVVRFNVAGTNRYKYFNTTDLNCMIGDLRYNSQYEFAVKVVNGRRESAWSMSVLNSTAQAASISPPRDLTVRADDKAAHSLVVQWQPPRQTSGQINGYIVFYTNDTAKRDRDWMVEAVVGETYRVVIKNLMPYTTYYFKVQTRSIKGQYGPFSTMVSHTTDSLMATSDGGGSGMNATGVGQLSNEMLIYLVVGIACTVFLIAIGVVVILCRRKTPETPEHTKESYHKNNTGVKPPDLWIHHDQMELKHVDKNSSTVTPGCSDGASISGAMTLPRSVNHEYEHENPSNSSHITNSLDKRSYVAGYMTTSMNSSIERPQYPRTQYNTNQRSHVAVDPTQSQQSLIQTQSGAGGVSFAQTPEVPYGYDSMPSNYSNPNITYAPGMSVDAPKRGQGHPLKSFSVPGPPSSAQLIANPNKHGNVPAVTIRPQNASPYKKSSVPPTVPSVVANRLQAGSSVAHSNDEIQRLAPSTSTEELNQEMANLEGLMKDLSAITANEFEC